MARDTQYIQGLDGVMEALRKLGKEASKRGGPTRAALFQGAKVIRTEVIARAPVDTGNLRKNIRMRRDPNPRSTEGATERFTVGVRGVRSKYANTKANVRKGIAGTNYSKDGSAFYWRFLEFGTSKMPARPFIRPAFEAVKQPALDKVVETLWKRIEALAKKVAGR